MRGDPGEGEEEVLGQHVDGGHALVGGRVELERRVQTVEDALRGHVHLALAAFFRRRAKDRDGAWQLASDPPEAQPRGNSRRADQVVTAAVADIGHTVVFGNQADVRAVPAPADRCGERGWQVGEAPHHVAGELLEEFGGAAGGVELLVIRLGTRVDVECELPDQPGILVHEVHGPPLDILHDFLPLPAS